MYEMIQILLRTFFSYILVYITFRILGKREIGELSIIDLIVFLMIAEITVFSIENINKPFIHSVIVIALLILLQKLLSYITLKNVKVREKLEGTPSVIVANGKVNYQEMKKQNYSFDDLMNQLRDKEIRSISEVDYAILEIGGTLSVFRKGERNISPLPVIISGHFIEENFNYLDIDKERVKQLLKEQGYDDISKVLYANYENDELFIIRLNPND
ncbi:DUF421 domain-containing protein [Mycoplasmatota bacterium]|nr:DUF421 domain-containing protein [Mycoplasmatota bacterium]